MSSRITILKATLLLLLADNAASLYTKHDKVERLDVDTFDDVTDSDALWLVEFFAPWCGHCQQLAPEWKAAAVQLADEIPDDVRLGAVDCTRNNGLCSKYKVDGYPTIKVFGEEKDKPTELSVGRTSADILTYVRGKLGRPAPPDSGSTGTFGGDGTPGGGSGGGSAALDDAWKTTKLPELEATHLFTVAYAVALFAPKSQDDELSIHIVETAPNRVVTRAFNWGNLGPLLRRVGHPCTDIKLTLISPHMDSSLHNVTKVYDPVQDCSVSAKFWRNFVDTSTNDQGFPEPDATVWLNVDAYMCPWRYSLLHSLSTAKPIVLSFFDERPAKSVQEMLSTTQRFRASFGEQQRTKCDEMSGTLYGFKWLAHKANQDWNLTETVNTALVDVFLPVAPNQFTAQDNDAPRYTDPTTLVTRPLGLNEWIVGVWYDQHRQGAGLKSIGESGAKKILAKDGVAGGHQEL